MLPFGGFWLGMRYQEKIMRSNMGDGNVESNDLVQDAR